MDCEPRLSSTVITKQKDNLTTELNKIKLVLENLDAQIDNKSNYQRSLSNIVLLVIAHTTELC